MRGAREVLVGGPEAGLLGRVVRRGPVERIGASVLGTGTRAGSRVGAELPGRGGMTSLSGIRSAASCPVGDSGTSAAGAMTGEVTGVPIHVTKAPGARTAQVVTGAPASVTSAPVVRTGRVVIGAPSSVTRAPGAKIAPEVTGAPTSGTRVPGAGASGGTIVRYAMSAPPGEARVPDVTIAQGVTSGRGVTSGLAATSEWRVGISGLGGTGSVVSGAAPARVGLRAVSAVPSGGMSGPGGTNAPVGVVGPDGTSVAVVGGMSGARRGLGRGGMIPRFRKESPGLSWIVG